MKRIEEELRNIRQQMEEDFMLHSERLSAQQHSTVRLEKALEVVVLAVDSMRQEFRDHAHASRAYHETWASERKRNLRLLDVIQSGLLTGGLESESRFEKIERRLARLEEDQSGAA